MRSKIFPGLLCVLIFLSPVYADEVYLTNGDRLTGRIDNMVDGKLILKSDLVGTVTIDVSNIRTLNSVAPLEIHLKDGKVLRRQITTSQQIELSSINAINPPPKPKPKWKGEISAGYNSAHGNTNTDNLNISAVLKKRTEKHRIKISGDYAKSREKDATTGKKEATEDWWKINGDYDYFLTKKLFTFAEAGYETDSIAQLDRRVILGGGLGYQWVESPRISFSTRAGLVSLYEKFENQGSGGSELAAHLGYDLNKQIKDNIEFTHSLAYYPAVDGFSDYFLTTTAEIKADITENTFTSFKVLFDYDATPADGSGNTDVKYIWAIGASF